MSTMEIVGWDKIVYNVFLNIRGKNINTSIVAIDSYHILKPFVVSHNKNKIKKALKILYWITEKVSAQPIFLDIKPTWMIFLVGLHAKIYKFHALVFLSRQYDHVLIHSKGA